MMRDDLVCRLCAVGVANRTLHGVIHEPPNRFDLEGIFLSALALYFYRYRDLLWLRLVDFS
jgi:hypothetical protein